MMERFHLYRPPGAGGAFMAAADDGPWVRLADAQAAFDAANQRATETERRLALAVAEVKAWRAWADVGDRDSTFTTDKARAATDADPELAKMIGGAG